MQRTYREVAIGVAAVVEESCCIALYSWVNVAVDALRALERQNIAHLHSQTHTPTHLHTHAHSSTYRIRIGLHPFLELLMGDNLPEKLHDKCLRLHVLQGADAPAARSGGVKRLPHPVAIPHRIKLPPVATILLLEVTVGWGALQRVEKVEASLSLCALQIEHEMPIH